MIPHRCCLNVPHAVAHLAGMQPLVAQVWSSVTSDCALLSQRPAFTHITGSEHDMPTDQGIAHPEDPPPRPRQGTPPAFAQHNMQPALFVGHAPASCEDSPNEQSMSVSFSDLVSKTLTTLGWVAETGRSSMLHHHRHACNQSQSTPHARIQLLRRETASAMQGEGGQHNLWSDTQDQPQLEDNHNNVLEGLDLALVEGSAGQLQPAPWHQPGPEYYEYMGKATDPLSLKPCSVPFAQHQPAASALLCHAHQRLHV